MCQYLRLGNCCFNNKLMMMKETSSVQQSLFKVNSRTNCFFFFTKVRGHRHCRRITFVASVLTRLSVTASGPTVNVWPQARGPLPAPAPGALCRGHTCQEQWAPTEPRPPLSRSGPGGLLYMFWVDINSVMTPSKLQSGAVWRSEVKGHMYHILQ